VEVVHLGKIIGHVSRPRKFHLSLLGSLALLRTYCTVDVRTPGGESGNV